MDSLVSERMLNETCHVGMLKVTIEGVGTISVEAVGEPLRLLASQVACFLTGKIGVSGVGNNPWHLVSYDSGSSTLVVRKKE